jgi:hypothetical protein
VGQVLCLALRPPLQKKSPSKKSSTFEFSNLTLKKREALGNGFNHWSELRSARKNVGKTDLVLLWESLLNEARTYFSKNLSDVPNSPSSHSLIARMMKHKS